jgi:hypothetical protein
MMALGWLVWLMPREVVDAIAEFSLSGEIGVFMGASSSRLLWSLP